VRKTKVGGVLPVSADTVLDAVPKAPPLAVFTATVDIDSSVRLLIDWTKMFPVPRYPSRSHENFFGHFGPFGLSSQQRGEPHQAI
jgi:hypothetical protein